MMKKTQLLGAPMHLLSLNETIQLINSRVASRIFTQHTVVNVAKVVNMRSDVELRKSVIESDIINIDGMGLVYGLRFLNKIKIERVAGIDLCWSLLSLASDNSYPVYFLGAKESVLHKTIDKVRSTFPNLHIAGFHHGYFWDDEEEMVEKIRVSNAAILFVAISSPKKEKFINKWRSQLGVTFAMGVGGTFDVIAGEVKRAPKWMQTIGLEWLYRVIQEPKRLARRYITTNSKFALLLLKEKMFKA